MELTILLLLEHHWVYGDSRFSVLITPRQAKHIPVKTNNERNVRLKEAYIYKHANDQKGGKYNNITIIKQSKQKCDVKSS